MAESVDIEKLYTLVWDYCTYLNKNVFPMYGMFIHTTSINRQGIPKSETEVRALNFYQLHLKVNEIIVYANTFKLVNDSELAGFHAKIAKKFDSYIQSIRTCDSFIDMMRENLLLKQENEGLRDDLKKLTEIINKMRNDITGLNLTLNYC